jgi:hypothetical protein
VDCRKQGGKMVKNVISLIILCSIVCGCTTSSFSPQPGASFSGRIDISQEKARTGHVFFTISDDGTKIHDYTLRLMNVLCNDVTIGMVDYTVVVDSPINGKRFNIESEYIGTLSGVFSSETRAGGYIQIVLKKTVTNITESCDLGQYKWSASVED